MANQNIKVLALDLDGTLTNDQKEITPRTRAAPEFRAEDLTARWQQPAARTTRMIQKIAFLLGEEVSENPKTIDSVIRALRVPATTPDAR